MSFATALTTGATRSGIYEFSSLLVALDASSSNYDVVLSLLQPTSANDSTPRFAGYRPVRLLG